MKTGKYLWQENARLKAIVKEKPSWGLNIKHAGVEASTTTSCSVKLLFTVCSETQDLSLSVPLPPTISLKPKYTPPPPEILFYWNRSPSSTGFSLTSGHKFTQQLLKIPKLGDDHINIQTPPVYPTSPNYMFSSKNFQDNNPKDNTSIIMWKYITKWSM